MTSSDKKSLAGKVALGSLELSDEELTLQALTHYKSLASVVGLVPLLLYVLPSTAPTSLSTTSLLPLPPKKWQTKPVPWE